MPETHDYRKPRLTWGHNITYRPIDGGRLLSAQGWGRGLKEGDYILLSNGSADTRYAIGEIDYYMDPKDMWKATLVFDPRTKPEDFEGYVNGGTFTLPLPERQG